MELLTNGDFESSFDGWEVTNGGSGWVIKTSDEGDGINWCESSYALCTMSQTVTLADKGISAEKIDAGNVTCNASAEMRSASEDYHSTGKGGRVCDVTVQMLDAGADVICVHLGLTRGGYLGAKKFIPIEEARKLITQIFRLCEEKRPEALRMIYAGPANTPADMLYLYKKTNKMKLLQIKCKQ